eukprot:570957_1
MAQEKKANPNLDLFTGNDYHSLVCGQHIDLVHWARNVLKNKNMDEKLKRLQQLKDSMIAQLKASCNDTYSVGVSIGNPMKDTVVLIQNNEQILVKLIMDPLEIDCKQRTFVTKTLSAKQRDAIFKTLYKLSLRNDIYKPQVRLIHVQLQDVIWAKGCQRHIVIV